MPQQIDLMWVAVDMAPERPRLVARRIDGDYGEVAVA
jgi:hypothetical protein